MYQIFTDEVLGSGQFGVVYRGEMIMTMLFNYYNITARCLAKNQPTTHFKHEFIVGLLSKTSADLMSLTKRLSRRRLIGMNELEVC